MLRSMLLLLLLPAVSARAWADETAEPTTSTQAVRVATFDIDATPPLGFEMAYDPVRRLDELGLRARGVVLMGGSDPIVLCAIDWIGIGNDSQTVFKQRIARAAGTTPDRVAVHTLHQHDAPRCDFSAERLLNEAGVSNLGPHNGSFARVVLDRLDGAIQHGLESAIPITHVGYGVADVKEVASNRRILGDDGKVRATRYTATRDAELRAEPAGVIDPQLSSISFWNKDQPIAALTYYACHPQSYYRTGVPSPDFPGIARFMRGQDLPKTLHVHFNGAGGNIGAGKFNMGDPPNRLVLAERVADAMRRAFTATEKTPIASADIQWEIAPVALPLAKHLEREDLRDQLTNWKTTDYWGSPDKLAWVLRCQAGDTIDIACLSIGDIRVLHMPGELFVEYQLAAKQMQPDLKVAMAAYGDYGPGYIGTEVAYDQGGYETSQPASNVAPEVESVLMEAMKKLLH